MSAVPEYDLSAEITRKAGDAYSWLDHQFKRGQLSSNAFFHALVALDLALLGLIPDEYSAWAADRRKSLNHADAGDTTVLYNDTRTVVLHLDREKGAVRMSAIVREHGVKVSTKEIQNAESEGDSFAWANAQYEDLRLGLLKKGFVELV